MKKLFALAALVLGLASCQTEPEGFGVVTGGEVDTVVTVSLPAATRSSEQSGLENVAATQFDLRYILEVYDVKSENVRVLREVKPYEVTETTVTFPVRLIAGRDYKFVVWADFVANGSTEDNFYNTQEGLWNVTVNENAWTAMTEARDAYTSFVDVTNYSGTQPINLELTRPFGKLRVVTTDIDALRYIQALPTAVEFQYAAEVYTSFNALYGEAGDLDSKTFDSYALSNVYNEDLTNGKQQTLFADYLFVGAEQTLTTKFHMQVTHAYGTKKTEYSFVNDAPIVRNQLTTIIGSILTDANDVKVVVNEEFAAENTIFDVFERGGEYTLTDDYVIDSPLFVKADAVLNLNGHSITNAEDNADTDVIIVRKGGKLTINGEGTIEAVSGNDGYAIISEGELVINGGTYKAGVDADGAANAVIYARGEGKVFVNGGYFPNEKNSTYVLNKKDADRTTTTIEVRGGKFVGFNPANNAAEGVGTCFVAEGYFSRQVAENVYEVAELAGEITLQSDIETAASLVVKEGTSAVVNLNGFDIINAGATEALGVADAIIVYGELEINGEGTVKGNTRSVWARGNTNAKITINGGNYVGAVVEGGCEVIYASGNGKITINGGTFEAANMDDSSFAAPQYAVLNLHGNGAAGCDIKVYGGSFKNFNPADNISENPKHNFCAEGCYADADGDWFEVIYDPYRGYTKVATLVELKEAIKTANNKIVFLNDITGDVTISNAVNINGDGKTYTGKMTLTADKTDVTIKNVNFDGKGYNGYAIETRGVYYVTIEDCTAKNYGYGFVQLASSTVLTTVKNVTVSNMNYGVKVDYSSAIVLENANFNVNAAAVLNSNYGEKSITIKNSYLNILGTWTRNNTTKTNYVFEGNNTINTFRIDAAIDNFKLAAGATLTAPNEINVTTDAGYTVEYADGKYISK